MDELVERFTSALHRLHEHRDVAGIVELFGDESKLDKVGVEHTETGPEGARRFWAEYRDVFDEIEASFTSIIEQDQSAALEWESRGTLANGRPITYQGVSVLHGEDGTLTSFRTYYDSATFLDRGPER